MTGTVNFYITQFLIGHGFFLAYLYKIGNVSSPACVYCETALDNAEHTFFALSRWTDKVHNRVLNTCHYSKHDD